MNWKEKDKDLVWHPYSHYDEEAFHIPLVRGKGSLLYDENGKEYIDAISSWWVNLHGHAHPYIAEQISAQLNTLEHSIFAGFTHPPAIQLAERLIDLLPGKLSKVFYSDNGSTATEIGLKQAIQYQLHRKEQRMTVVAFDKAYHGDTFGAMSVGARSVFTHSFQHLLFDVERIPTPVAGQEDEAIERLTQIVKSGSVGAFIFEPLLLAAGGMLLYSPKVLDQLIRICKAHGVVTIADEVVTGFGRTGRNFACDHLEESPDIVCLAKGLTGGTMAMGATVCSETIFSAFKDADKRKTFYHGHSYTGNPLACTAALASLDLLEEPKTEQNRTRINARLAAEKEKFAQHPLVENARNLGGILAFEVKTEDASNYLNSLRDWLYAFFIDHGVLIRPLGNTINVIPPYCTTEDQLDRIFEVVGNALDQLHAESAKASLV